MSIKKIKLIRTSTVPQSLNSLLIGQLKMLNEHFEVIAVSGHNKSLEEVKSREGVRVEAISMERHISVVADLISLIRLYKLFSKEKPDIVHSITPKAGLLSMMAAKAARVPIRMHTFTGLIFPTEKGLMQKLLIKMDKLLCWSATNIYPEGKGVKEDLIKYKITSKPLKVLANGNINGINLKHYNPRTITEQNKTQLENELGITDNDFVFVFVGRIVGDKGINELISAFDKIKGKTKRQVKLLLVGPYESEIDPLLPKTLKTIDYNKNIISVGYQNDVRPYFAISDALAFPSYREGFPNVVMQAGAMELPAIVSDINGCNEIIIDGNNGLIIPSKDEEALLSAMILIAEDDKLYRDLKQNARPMIESRYEQSIVWKDLLEEYKINLSKKTNDF